MPTQPDLRVQYTRSLEGRPLRPLETLADATRDAEGRLVELLNTVRPTEFATWAAWRTALVAHDNGVLLSVSSQLRAIRQELPSAKSSAESKPDSPAAGSPSADAVEPSGQGGNAHKKRRNRRRNGPKGPKEEARPEVEEDDSDATSASPTEASDGVGDATTAARNAALWRSSCLGLLVAALSTDADLMVVPCLAKCRELAAQQGRRGPHDRDAAVAAMVAVLYESARCSEVFHSDGSASAAMATLEQREPWLWESGEVGGVDTNKLTAAAARLSTAILTDDIFELSTQLSVLREEMPCDETPIQLGDGNVFGASIGWLAVESVATLTARLIATQLQRLNADGATGLPVGKVFRPMRFPVALNDNGVSGGAREMPLPEPLAFPFRIACDEVD